MLIGIEQKYGHPFRYAITIVNGEPALATYIGDALYALTFCRADGERMTDLYRIMNPDKLRGITDRLAFG